MLIQDVEVTVVADLEHGRHDPHADSIALTDVEIDDDTQRTPPRMVIPRGKNQVSQRHDPATALRYARNTVAATRHPVRIAAGLVVLLGVALAAAAVSGVFRPSRPSLTPAQIAEQKAIRTTKRLLAQQAKLVRVADALVAVTLPPQPSRLSAGSATPANLFTTPLAPVEVLGYVPYWEAPDLTAADFADTSVLAIYGVEVARNGSFLESGPGWAYYADTGYSAAHRGRGTERETACCSRSRRRTRASSATSRKTPRRLARALPRQWRTPSPRAGSTASTSTSKALRTPTAAGFVSFVVDFVSSLRHDGMHKMVVLNCYPQSAGGSTDFFDVAKPRPWSTRSSSWTTTWSRTRTRSANAPLTNGDLGLSDVLSLIQYRRVVPASKLVLGIPFYGVDFTTTTGKPGSLTLTESPTVETYATIAAAGGTPLWDPGSQTVWTRFREGGSWHETWFDDPVSVALETCPRLGVPPRRGRCLGARVRGERDRDARSARRRFAAEEGLRRLALRRTAQPSSGSCVRAMARIRRELAAGRLVGVDDPLGGRLVDAPCRRGDLGPNVVGTILGGKERDLRSRSSPRNAPTCCARAESRSGRCA